MAKKIYFKRIKSHQNQSRVLIGRKSYALIGQWRANHEPFQKRILFEFETLDFYVTRNILERT